MNEPAQPVELDENAEYWAAARDGKLLLKRCLDTGRCFYYPREYSPFTGGKTEWMEASGRGTVYSCSVNYRASPPNCIAYVELAEGPIILSTIEAEDLETVAIGQAVELVFRTTPEGIAFPLFRPVERN